MSRGGALPRDIPAISRNPRLLQPAEFGLEASSPTQLRYVIFEDGISTKQSVTEFSGRGVGMAAVRQECEARQGQVDIQSEPGRGTTMEFRFPAAEMFESVVKAA